MDELTPIGKTVVVIGVAMALAIVIGLVVTSDKPKTQATVQGTHTETVPATPPAAPKCVPPLRYDPPISGYGSATADYAYKKSPIEGTVYTVEFFSDGPYGNAEGRDSDGNDKPSTHLVPDYTTITYDPANCDDCRYETIDICGNVMDKFNPNQSIKMIVKDSKLSDYNGCHTTSVVELTFGGKGLAPERVGPENASRVPGAR